MNPSLGVPFGQQPLTLSQKEAARRWSSKKGMPSEWLDAHARESRCVTVVGPLVLGPRGVEEIYGDSGSGSGGGGGSGAGGGEVDGGGAAAGPAAVGTRSGRPGKVLVRFTAHEQHPEVDGKQIEFTTTQVT